MNGGFMDERVKNRRNDWTKEDFIAILIIDAIRNHSLLCRKRLLFSKGEIR